jgi:hypothetical protein
LISNMDIYEDKVVCEGRSNGQRTIGSGEISLFVVPAKAGTQGA